MVAWGGWYAVVEPPDLASGVRWFASEMWPGERLTASELRRLAALAGLDEREGGGRGAAARGEDRRIETALEVARCGGGPELRRWAWRGWLRRAPATVRPEHRAWSLALDPLLPEPYELWLVQRLDRMAAALADLWAAGEAPVLVLRDLPRWARASDGALRAGRVQRRLARALERQAARRGWRGPIEVLVVAE